MKRIDQDTYEQLLASATVLERDGHGAKVLALADSSLVKVFRRKRWLSTALVFPYAHRFARNARRLAERGIVSVRVLDTAYCPALARHLVTYRPLPGVTLRQALKAAADQRPHLLAAFAAFVAILHRKGVYFRSLHFGNVIVPPDGSPLGLIDVADLRTYAWPLPSAQRVRNFSHMLRYAEDRAALQEYGWPNFLDGYLAAAALAPRHTLRLHRRLQPIDELLTPNR
jgi:hypothetical protein